MFTGMEPVSNENENGFTSLLRASLSLRAIAGFPRALCEALPPAGQKHPRKNETLRGAHRCKMMYVYECMSNIYLMPAESSGHDVQIDRDLAVMATNASTRASAAHECAAA